jgi:glycosyltransferase involved in cell wall biosynthesis
MVNMVLKNSSKELNTVSSGVDAVELSIVIPTYNEENNVIPLYTELSDVLGSIGSDFEMIFVDDGSRDGTFQKLQFLHAKDNRVKVIKFKKNFGQSAAMTAGFNYAHGKVIVTMDADLQNDPFDIPSLLQELDYGYDVVCGWRHNRRDSISKRGFSKYANWLRRRWTGESIHDSGCSLRAYRNECLNDLELYGEMHRYIPALLLWKGYKIHEVEVAHRPRIQEKTKYNWQRLPKGFLDLIMVTFWQRYSLRPMHIFGGLGFLLAIIGTVLGLYLGFQRIFFGFGLADRPLFLLAILMVIVGIQFAVFGVLADIMIRVYYGQGDRKIYVVEEVIE